MDRREDTPEKDRQDADESFPIFPLLSILIIMGALLILRYLA